MPSRLIVVLVSLLLATPVIFWLCLVVVPARVAILCPEECVCDPGGYFVHCNGPSLTAVPSIRLTHVRALSFSYNKIGSLVKDSFVWLNELEELSIYMCGLRAIELGAFNGLTELTALYIWSNEISEIKPGTFEYVNSLEYLEFYDNRLEHLHSDVFSGLVNLKQIDLGHNKLQQLHPDTFLGLPNFQKLRLSENWALQIPTDRNFINSHSLSYLDLSNCNVISVSVETFANVSALESLDLSNNELMSVDINMLNSLPKLSTLYLYGNPLQCYCQLQEVWRWCEDRDIQTEKGRSVPECDTPSEVKGMWWGVLQQVQCLEGNIQYYGDYNSTSYSYTDIDRKDFNEYDFEFFKQHQVPFYAFPFIFGTTGNVILLIIIICNKDMRNVPNMYIINLAISGIIYLTVLFFEACANTISDTWLSGDFLCTFIPLCHRMSVGLSAYSVALYTFHQYRITVKPFKVLFFSQGARRVCVATICGVWIVASLFAVPSALSKYLCEGLFLSKSTKYYRLVVIFELLVSCVIPLFVVAFSYVMTARNHVKLSRLLTEGGQNPQQLPSRNYAKSVVGLAVVFMISYVPYHVFWTYFIYSEEEQFLLPKITDILDQSNYKLRYTYLILTGLLLINSCLNPVALFCTRPSFRQHLKRYLTRFCKSNSPLTDFELTRRN